MGRQAGRKSYGSALQERGPPPTNSALRAGAGVDPPRVQIVEPEENNRHNRINPRSIWNAGDGEGVSDQADPGQPQNGSIGRCHEAGCADAPLAPGPRNLRPPGCKIKQSPGQVQPKTKSLTCLG